MLATYGQDFYAGRPALTVNRYGKGKAYYVTSNNDDRFLGDLYSALSSELDVLHSLEAQLPHGVSAQLRTDGEVRYIFVMKFNAEPTSLDLGTATYTDLLTGDTLSGVVGLATYDVKVLTEMGSD